MEWKEYKKLYKKIQKGINKEFREVKKRLIEDVDELRYITLISLSLTLQREVPEEERRRNIKNNNRMKNGRNKI